MKVIVDDFNYRGQHFDHCEFDFPQLKDVDDLDEERITDYIKESLDKNFFE